MTHDHNIDKPKLPLSIMRLLALPPALLSLLLITPNPISAFYLPGLSPTDYREGDPVQLNVNRLTPSVNDPFQSVYSFDYYHHSFHHCEPPGGAQDVSEGLGSVLFGDRIQTSPYRLRMRVNETCKASCDEVTIPGRDAIFVNRRIRQQYNINWLIDGLPAAERYRDNTNGEDFYLPGFSIGRVVQETPRLNNHYNILIDYHVAGNDQYRVVGVEAVPESRADARRIGTGDDFSAECGDPTGPLVLDEDADNRLTYTYSVYWRESEVPFATRWDKYLRISDPKIHWLVLINSAVLFMFLVGIVSTILSRTLKKDIARYNRLDQYDLHDLNGTGIEDNIQEDSGWKLIYGDVFRPPKNSLALSILIGNGAQLFLMTAFTIAFAVVGFLSPSNRGSLATAMILLYTIFSAVSGYTAARVYKSFRGSKWKALFISTPCATPVVVFTTFFTLNFFLWIRGSSGAVPFTTMLIIVAFWFLLSLPLSLAGSWAGFRQEASDFPVKPKQIPRQIPLATGWLRPVPSMAAAAVLPFGAIFLELFFIINSLWSGRIYYMFGFLLLSFLLLAITTAATTLMTVYFVLCAEDYRWQWRAFGAGGASGAYVLLAMLGYWVQSFSVAGFTGSVIYLGYSVLLAVLFAVLTGESCCSLLVRFPVDVD